MALVLDGTTGTISGIGMTEINGFRLTLTSGVPVTLTDVTAAATLYACPYKGKTIALYSGGTWGLYTSNEFSLSLTGLLTNARPHDVWCVLVGGVPTLALDPWSNDTARAAALAYQDGVLVKSGDPTRRYLGTLYATGTGTTEDSQTSRYLWNYHHRVLRPFLRKESNASWTYSAAAWRQANGNTANQVNFVLGLAEDVVSAQLHAWGESNASGDSIYVALGLDTTTTYSALPGHCQTSAGGRRNQMVARFEQLVGIGRHYLSWNELGNGVNTQTWLGIGYGAVEGQA